ncbi:MAG: manganese transport system permease protein [Chthoniobacter sp.]|jgi:ABC-type Mn2+/Zn2+ transport system permease subunit|nr:manganese transport system permease protein [Chthoniobacter sp.]
MEWLFEPFQHEFMRRVFVGGALIGFTNGFLGAFVVLRRLALMADSLSHSLLPGLAVGVMLFGLAPAGLFFGALLAALFVALGAQLLARSSRLKEDTALGILYTVAFSLGVVLISFVKVRVSLMHYLFGNILGLSNADLWTAYGISLVVVPLLAALQRPLLLTLFDPTVALSQGIRVNTLNLVLMVCLVLTMIASLQAVGIILLLGLLITPAATIYLLCDSYPGMLWGGGFLGMFGSCAGLLLSYRMNLPSGACIVLVLGLIFFLAYLFSPRYGLLRRWRRPRHFHEESLARWSEEEHEHHHH